VLGRQFSHGLISAIALMRQQQLDNALEQLVRAELIFRRGTPPFDIPKREVWDRAAAAQRRRREQDALFAHFLVVVGEDALRTLLEAITQNSEQPLARLPLKWRERAIAAFRQVPLRRESANCALEAILLNIPAARFTAGRFFRALHFDFCRRDGALCAATGVGPQCAG
jgi:hypothetical protein